MVFSSSPTDLQLVLNAIVEMRRPCGARNAVIRLADVNGDTFEWACALWLDPGLDERVPIRHD